MIENQIKIIEIVKEWMHGCVIENTRKIKIKLENIWIDLFRSIYAPYIFQGLIMAVLLQSNLLCLMTSMLTIYPYILLPIPPALSLEPLCPPALNSLPTGITVYITPISWPILLEDLISSFPTHETSTTTTLPSIISSGTSLSIQYKFTAPHTPQMQICCWMPGGLLTARWCAFGGDLIIRGASCSCGGVLIHQVGWV